MKASGYSHRRFIILFERAVGLTPKRYCRLQRFQAALVAARRSKADLPWIEVALAAGYSDQAHLVRDFREFAGIPPSLYRALAPARANHVPVRLPSGRSPGFNFVQALSPSVGEES
ncbi:MAG TPA: helix-turn-helix domain-containing protein [Myxococcaceae bacterium]|nr:helix-turn-helix domain-containing protein [Myxococcaceae bacterium]